MDSSTLIVEGALRVYGTHLLGMQGVCSMDYMNAFLHGRAQIDRYFFLTVLIPAFMTSPTQTQQIGLWASLRDSNWRNLLLTQRARPDSSLILILCFW